MANSIANRNVADGFTTEKQKFWAFLSLEQTMAFQGSLA
jgi:hypothetical protein